MPPHCRYVTWCARLVCMQQPYRPGMPCLLDKLTWHSFFVVHMSVHFVSYTVAWDFMLRHILITVTSPCSAHALAQARPTMHVLHSTSYFGVLKITSEGKWSWSQDMSWSQDRSLFFSKVSNADVCHRDCTLYIPPLVLFQCIITCSGSKYCPSLLGSLLGSYKTWSAKKLSENAVAFSI